MKVRRRGSARLGLVWLGATALCCALMLATGSSALAASETTTYTATQTLPVPPASSFAGSGGGDGWAVAVGTKTVYNVFHHSSVLTVACHEQKNADPCWTPETITDASGNNFATSGQPGLHLDLSTGKLYVYATRSFDGTGGVVCIDTTIAATNPDPFCGFTALTPVGSAPLYEGISNISDPALVGSRWYAFNYVNGATATGAENQLLCFDFSTLAPCAGQPYDIGIGSGNVSDGSYPPPAVAAIGAQIIVPVTVGSTDELACYDASAGAVCSGSWPVALGFSYDSEAGAPFPLLSSTGTILGLCLPIDTDPCYSQTGASVATPTGMTDAISNTSGWDGPAFLLGPRVYVPNGNTNQVDCYDYSTSASCTNFPLTLNNLELLYTVNPDPQRPTCIWVNSDGGTDQIQDFDAYTGGPCGQGAIRALASQFVVPQAECTPISYDALQVLSPAPGSYTSGSVQFDDGDGNPISGAPPETLDDTGTVDLTGLDLSSPLGLPQFLITLTGETTSATSVTVKLSWTATYDPSCIGPGVTVAQTPSTVTTSLSGAGQNGASVTVPAGTPVTDNAALSGDNASTATGTVTYTVYSDSSCSTVAQAGSAESISTAGSPPASAPVTLTSPGTYYWMASYSGDGSNFNSQSNCGDEIETVTPSSSVSPPTLPGTSAPKLSGAPTLSGTTKAGSTLTCSTGTWTGSPTSYMYAWYRDGTLLAGVTGPTHKLGKLDEGTTYYCVVTASNIAGSASAASNKLSIPVPHVKRCPAATGKMTGTKIGQLKLGMTRHHARFVYRRHSNRGRQYQDFFCLTPIGIRVGYATPKLLKTLSASTQNRLRGHVVWASTSNPYYALDGVRPGQSISTASRTLHTGRPFHIGRNYWYLARKSNYTAVLKVRGGVVEETGIATNSLTKTRKRQNVLMHSFY